MITLLLKLFGVKIEQALRVVSVALEFRNGAALGGVIVGALLLAALAWWTYHFRAAGGALARWRKIVLTALRVIFFFLILFIVLRPVLSFTVEGSIRRTLLTLMDVSTSMNIQDPRTDATDVKRATTFVRSGDAKHVARIELLKAVLQDSKLHLLPDLAKDFDLSTFTFGKEVAELSQQKSSPGQPPEQNFAWAKNLAATSPLTAMGDAVREVINRKRGQPLAGIFLATDGANNAGSAALEAASLAQQENVPLYIYGVGITSPRDIIVANLFTQEVAFVKDELPVTVRVRGQGLRGESAHLVLKLGEETVAEKDLTFTGDEEQVVPLNFTPQKTGEFDLTASIAPRDDETVRDNNAASQRVRVIDSKIKVLWVEQAPRWEFRYAENVLLRDRRIDFKCVLVEGDPSIAQGKNSPYLARFPAAKEELFKFDLLILGDVDAKMFSPAQLDAINEFVSKFGGSCVFLAGKKFNPAAYRQTALEKLLPVELEQIPSPARPADRPIPLAITPAGKSEVMLKLASEETENAEIWRQFPPVYWLGKVERSKPAAQVFIEDPDPTHAARFGKMPVMALQQYGLGQVLYIGTDNLWRWRKNAGEQHYSTLWGQIAQRMALAHLLGGSKRTQLTLDKQKYNAGDRVSVYARLYNEKFEPVKEPSIDGAYAIKTGGGAGESHDVQLRAVPEQPGMYRGDFVPVSAGAYQFSVKNDPKTVVEFSVTEPKFELGETAMNETLLKQMAEASGGAFFREEDLPKLAETIGKNTERVRSTVDADLWSSPIYFLLLFLVATTEWILRKRSLLK